MKAELTLSSSNAFEQATSRLRKQKLAGYDACLSDALLPKSADTFDYGCSKERIVIVGHQDLLTWTRVQILVRAGFHATCRTVTDELEQATGNFRALTLLTETVDSVAAVRIKERLARQSPCLLMRFVVTFPDEMDEELTIPVFLEDVASPEQLIARVEEVLGIRTLAGRARTRTGSEDMQSSVDAVHGHKPDSGWWSGRGGSAQPVYRHKN